MSLNQFNTITTKWISCILKKNVVKGFHPSVYMPMEQSITKSKQARQNRLLLNYQAPEGGGDGKLPLYRFKELSLTWIIKQGAGKKNYKPTHMVQPIKRSFNGFY